MKKHLYRIDENKHTLWGMGCQNFDIVNETFLSIKKETMPPGSSEQLHHHKTSEQYFYILNGKALFSINENKIKAGPTDTIRVYPNDIHAIENCGTNNLNFLLFSLPRINRDRFEASTNMYNLNNRKFTVLNNSESGEVNEETIFSYFEKDEKIWAQYAGGQIKIGSLSGFKTSKDTLQFKYGHWDNKNNYRSGTCESRISISEKKAKLILNEKWKWDGGEKGSSILREL